jgi:hypothetical protein
MRLDAPCREGGNPLVACEVPREYLYLRPRQAPGRSPATSAHSDWVPRPIFSETLQCPSRTRPPRRRCRPPVSPDDRLPSLNTTQKSDGPSTRELKNTSIPRTPPDPQAPLHPASSPPLPFGPSVQSAVSCPWRCLALPACVVVVGVVVSPSPPTTNTPPPFCTLTL